MGRACSRASEAKAGVVALALLLGAATPLAQGPATPPHPSLAEILERLSTYLDDYADKLSRTVASERYTQTSGLGQPGVGVAAVLESEFGIVKVPDYEGWLGFRDVLKVNGRTDPEP